MIYRFGPFIFDEVNGDLLKGGISIKVQPQPLALLALLLREPGRLVSKDEIYEAIWPGIAVQEQSIFQCVNQLRKALGDSTPDAKFIQTVPKRGYRWAYKGAVQTEDPLETAVAPDRAKQEMSMEPLSPQPDIPERDPMPDTAPATKALSIEQATPNPPTAPTIPDPTPAIRLETQPAPGTTHLPPSPSPRLSAPERPLWRLVAPLSLLLFFPLLWFWYRGHGPSAAPASKPALAVLPLFNATGDPDKDWVELGLLDMVLRNLRAVNQAETLEMQRILSIQAEAAQLNRRPTDAQLAKAIGERLKSRYLVVSRLEKNPKGYHIAYQVWDEGVVGPLVRIEDGDFNQLASLFTQALRQRFEIGLPEHDEVFVMSGDPFIDEVYARGIQQLLTGGAAKAQAYFQVCLDKDPNYLWAKHQMAACHDLLGNYELAESTASEVLKESEVRKDDKIKAVSLMVLGNAAYRQTHWAKAKDYYLQAQSLFKEVGERMLEGRSIANLANIAVVEHELELAADLYGQARQIMRESGDRFKEANLLGNMGSLEQELGRYDQAVAYYKSSMKLRMELNDRQGLGWVQDALGGLYGHLQDFPLAEQHFRASLAIQKELGNRSVSRSMLTHLAYLALIQGKDEEARARRTEILAMAKEDGVPAKNIQCHELDPVFALAEGDPKKALNSALAFIAANNLPEEAFSTAKAAQGMAYDFLRAGEEEGCKQILAKVPSEFQASWAQQFLEGVVLYEQDKLKAASERLHQAKKLAGPVWHPKLDALLQACDQPSSPRKLAATLLPPANYILGK